VAEALHLISEEEEEGHEEASAEGAVKNGTIAVDAAFQAGESIEEEAVATTSNQIEFFLTKIYNSNFLNHLKSMSLSYTYCSNHGDIVPMRSANFFSAAPSGSHHGVSRLRTRVVAPLPRTKK